ncbi:MAG: carbohydrate porin [Verrucomicrobiaceae bacterium]|nr:MAG: carbohydrate porin [Verrucomicrobiaceae bacterium]
MSDTLRAVLLPSLLFFLAVPGQVHARTHRYESGTLQEKQNGPSPEQKFSGEAIAAERAVSSDLYRFPNWLEAEFVKAGDKGITPFFSYWGIFQGNPVGGLSQEVAYAHEMLFGATFDMEKLVGWKGASFKISGSENSGTNLSATIPNVFNTAESYVCPTGMFYEMYYTQKLFDDFLEFRIGRMVAADQFCVLPAFGLQVSGGIDGNPTSIFLNSNFTSSPNATWGATVKINPTPIVYAAAGIYQATNRLGKVAYHGLDFSIRSNDGILMFAETGWSPTFGARPADTTHDKDGKKTVVPAETGLSGTYKFGGYFSTFPYAGFLGGSQQNTYGFYLIGQQTVWQSEKNSNHNLAVWGGVTYSPQYQVAQMPVMGFGGTIWQGLIPTRDQDQFLCTWMTGAFSSAYADSQGNSGNPRPTAETVFDVSYIINLTSTIFIQPDIQYIIQPNGVGTTPNALVIGAQFGCNF